MHRVMWKDWNISLNPIKMQVFRKWYPKRERSTKRSQAAWFHARPHWNRSHIILNAYFTLGVYGAGLSMCSINEKYAKNVIDWARGVKCYLFANFRWKIAWNTDWLQSRSIMIFNFQSSLVISIIHTVCSNWVSSWRELHIDRNCLSIQLIQIFIVTLLQSHTGWLFLNLFRETIVECCAPFNYMITECGVCVCIIGILLSSVNFWHWIFVTFSKSHLNWLDCCYTFFRIINWNSVFRMN